MLVGRSLFPNLEEYTCGVSPTQGRTLHTLQGETGHCLSCLSTLQDILEHPMTFVPSATSCVSGLLGFCVRLCYLVYGNCKVLEKYLLIVHLGQLIQIAL